MTWARGFRRNFGSISGLSPAGDGIVAPGNNAMTQSRAGVKSRTSNVVASEDELPTAKAFVLQLSRETGPALTPFVGRVEHLATGRRSRFHTVEEFLAAVARLLGGVRHP